MNKLESYEIDFIRETYPDPEWLVDDIAEKLEMCPQTIRKYAALLGVTRPPAVIRTPSHDWEAIYYARQRRIAYEDIAEQVGVSVEGAKAAMRRMVSMTEAERIIRWNLYRKKNGKPLLTKC